MTYIENVFICMVSPLLIAALCMGKKQLRFFLFCIAGWECACFLPILIPSLLQFISQMSWRLLWKLLR